MRHYYKSKNGKSWFSLKEPKIDTNCVEITEAEWNAHIAEMKAQPNPAQIARRKKLKQISELKAELAKSDYKTLKYAEGWLTEEEYAPIKAERQVLRNQINALEQDL